MNEDPSHHLITDGYNHDKHFDHFPDGFNGSVKLSRNYVGVVRERVVAKIGGSRMPYNALDRGLRPHELRGHLKGFIEKLMSTNPIKNRRYILFQGMVFVIALDEYPNGFAEVCFITCFHLGPQERQEFRKIWKERRKNPTQ